MSDRPEATYDFQQCPLCDYDLRGLDGGHQCPECGFTWDPRVATFAYQNRAGVPRPGRLILVALALLLLGQALLIGARQLRLPGVVAVPAVIGVVALLALLLRRRTASGPTAGVLAVVPRGLRRMGRDGRTVTLSWLIFGSARVKHIRADLYRLRLYGRTGRDWVSWVAAVAGPQYYFQANPRRAAAVQQAINSAIAAASGSARAARGRLHPGEPPRPRGGAAAAARTPDRAG